MGDAHSLPDHVEWKPSAITRGDRDRALTEIPEHLLRRAQAARQRAHESAGGESAADSSDESGRIPAHLLDRAQAARQRSTGSSDAGEGSASTAVAAAASGSTSAATLVALSGAIAPGMGPGGHTQRLLTVVKSGSIQEVKATPVDKVHTWPHLIAAEFVAALACLAFVFFFAIFVNAPLLQLANPNQTPNPSKAPWYFLGLQELLAWNLHPMIAGVTLPGVGLIILMMAPYIDKNPSNKPEDRKFATSIMTIHIMFWAALAIVGSFFRGPGFNFVLPWKDGLFFEL